MSWYGNRLPKFVDATTEERLQKKLGLISIGIGEKLEIVNIYPRGGKIVAWYFLDIGKIGRLPPEDKAIKKKSTKKKASK